LVQSIIGYVHQLDKEVVAEGVETREQAEILEAMSCDIIQGYYYSKPLKPQDVLAYYHEWAEDEKQQFAYNVYE
jgi:EAL domain-containing protein (putative c-di-GMP-specific phosphodiesterase class I)